ncbi:MAG TPA: GNAT family N-acetyltransferase [Polyangia bacterium]|jgi:GNAT superfamily N-acetyltransferase|nr:GNAT family N-acetyltransferase [Polyangia bacterium]
MFVSDTAAPRWTSSPALRPIRFEEVAATLDLIQRAIDHGCCEHYDRAQRNAVFLTYAQGLFAEVPGPFESIVAVDGEAPVGFAQFDPAADRLRALFVDGHAQHLGIGSLLLAEIERRLQRRGGRRLHGAMSLNAVPFYTRAGFRPCSGPERLTSAGVPVPVVRMEKLFRS